MLTGQGPFIRMGDRALAGDTAPRRRSSHSDEGHGDEGHGDEGDEGHGDEGHGDEGDEGHGDEGHKGDEGEVNEPVAAATK
jgi:hypothetical protein